MSDDPEDEKLIDFLNAKIENIEERLKKVSEALVSEMHKDVMESKKLKVKSQK